MVSTETEIYKKNKLVELLPEEERSALLARAGLVRMKLRDVVAERGRDTGHVHFPVDCVFSMATPLVDGGMIEVGTVGNQAAVGVQLMLDEHTNIQEVYCQVPGNSLRVPSSDFLAVIAKNGVLSKLCQRYISALINFLAQSVACNSTHSINERCAKWMLMTRDRVADDEFKLTQEFLAMMLGVNRPSVSVAAATLQKAGLISYKRGVVRILHREGLEDAVCECYEVTKQEFERALRLA